MDDDPAPFLKKTFKIGSNQSRKDYRVYERVFHPSDVPRNARQARRDVLESLRKAHSSKVRPNTWNASVWIGTDARGRVAGAWATGEWEERQYRQRLHEEKMREASIAQEEKSRSHSRVSVGASAQGSAGEEPEWVFSTTVPTRKGDRGTLRQASSPSPEVQRRMNMTKAKLNAKTYKNPVQRQKEMAETMRRELQATRRAQASRAVALEEERQTDDMHAFPIDFEEHRATLKKHRPHCSSTRLRDAGIVEETYTKESLEEFLRTYDDDAEMTRIRDAKAANAGAAGLSRAQLRKLKMSVAGSTRKTARQPPNRFNYEHLGSWGFSELEQQEVWSCCMSADRKSRGCTPTPLKSAHAWNFT